MIEDGNGINLPIPHLWVANETSDILEKAIECFFQFNFVKMTNTICNLQRFL